MKKVTLKRIISILLALILTFSALSSLTSCRIVFGPFSSDGAGDGAGGGAGGGAGDQTPSDNNGAGGDETGGGAPEFFPTDEGASIENLSSAQIALLSAVKIVATFEVYTGYGTSTATAIQYGSGLIYKLDKGTGDAYVITNYHVVNNKNSKSSSKASSDIALYLYGQEGEPYKIKATYLGGSMSYDTAVLRVKGSEVLKNSYARAVTLGNSDTLVPLDSVVAIGAPNRQCLAVTEGIVSVDSEDLPMLGADGYTQVTLRVMRISAAINEGNSGGGLFDASGKLIGIVVAKKTGSEIDNMAYAIPINLAKNTADAIIHYCDGETNTSLYKCFLDFIPGAEVTGLVIDSESGKIFKAEKVIVESILDGSILSGIIGIGDVINSITVDGVKKEVTRSYHVLDHMMTARVGSTVTLNITRDDITFDTHPVTLTESTKQAVK
ncbi:MAG: trypsin-like peptidase domain-containing protein [Clostridia bacterium]|nr:trypsin-like peptidase domain-containing protein [Clostridia bacterium]